MCTQISGEPVKMQIFIQQVQGRTQDSYKQPESTWRSQGSLLKSQDYVTILPAFHHQMAACPPLEAQLSLGPRTRLIDLPSLTNAGPFKWEQIHPSEAFLSGTLGGASCFLLCAGAGTSSTASTWRILEPSLCVGFPHRLSLWFRGFPSSHPSVPRRALYSVNAGIQCLLKCVHDMFFLF